VWLPLPVRLIASKDLTVTVTVYPPYWAYSGIWKAILVAVFFSVWLQISATVAPIGVKLSMMIYIGPGQIFSRFGGGDARVPKNPKFWPSKNKYLENGNSQHCMSIRRGLFKNVTHGLVAPPPPEESIISKKYVAFLGISASSSSLQTRDLLLHGRAAFVYHELSVDTIGRTPCESGVCVSRVVGRHNRPHTMRVFTLLSAVMDQIFVDNRDFYTPPAFLPSLKKGATVLRPVCVLLTHLLNYWLKVMLLVSVRTFISSSSSPAAVFRKATSRSACKSLNKFDMQHIVYNIHSHRA